MHLPLRFGCFSCLFCTQRNQVTSEMNVIARGSTHVAHAAVQNIAIHVMALSFSS
jgi:hypothetical protein